MERLGLPFEVRSVAVDEAALPEESAAGLAARLAIAKAESARLPTGTPDEVIVGADQVATRDGELLRKPGGYDIALDQLSKCQGKTVTFFTATTVIDCDSGRQWHGLEDTEVEFLALSQQQLGRYLELEQPYDCAGGFKAEGLGISLFRAIRSSDPTALLGLPMIWLTQTLRDLGLDPLDPLDPLDSRRR